MLVGAFGAHALKPVLDAKAMGWVDTGAVYQSTHALALILCGLLPASKHKNRTALFFMAGIVLFCGSLYSMALTGSTRLAIITPVGGVFFVAGWLSFCWMVFKMDDK